MPRIVVITIFAVQLALVVTNVQRAPIFRKELSHIQRRSLFLAHAVRIAVALPFKFTPAGNTVQQRFAVPTLGSDAGLSELSATFEQEACLRNVTNDLQAQADIEHAQQVADWQERQKTVHVEAEDDGFDDYDDDPALRELEEKRLAALKARFNREKEFHAQGHGEYREIVCRQVCGQA